MMKTTPILLAAALAVSIHSAQAASGTWTGNASGNWNVNSNWTGASFPTTGETATFNADVTNSTVSMNGTTVSLTSIIFDTSAEAYTFNAGGGSLQLAALSINSSVGAVTQTFNLAVNIDATSQLNNSSTSAILNLAGGVNNIGATARTLRFNFSGTGVGTTSVNGLSQTGGGALSIEKLLSGKVILTGTSTSTGANTIRDGILQLNSAGALGTGQVQFSGGIIGLGSGDFTRALGSGANQIRWVAPTTNTAAGFAAYGANRTVNLGGANGTITWNATSSIRTEQQLALGSVDSTHNVTFRNGINLSDAARTIVANNGISSTNVDGEISGVISSTSSALGSVIKTGAGTLLLSGNNTYTGLTTVSGGALLVGNSSGFGSLAGAVIVGSSAILGGSGTIAGGVTIQNGATLAPGNSPGLLTVNNNVTIESGGIFSVEINGAVAGTGHDSLVMTGDAPVFSLTGTNDLKISLNSFMPTVNTLFFLANISGSAAIDGTFESLNGATTTLTQGSLFTVGAQAFTISYIGHLAGNSFTGGNDLVIQAVPEPSTWMLPVLGGIFLLFRRWARRSKASAELS